VSRESNLYDLLAAYDELAAHPYVDGSAIAVVGSSYGGYLATILTSMRPVSWLALRAPALYIDTGWELPKLQLHKDHDLRAYRRSFVEAATNRALRACSDVQGRRAAARIGARRHHSARRHQELSRRVHADPLAHLPLHAGCRSRAVGRDEPARIHRAARAVACRNAPRCTS
jgi:pimeloyl-ACP methyl ester carboxylesterase